MKLYCVFESQDCDIHFDDELLEIFPTKESALKYIEYRANDFNTVLRRCSNGYFELWNEDAIYTRTDLYIQEKFLREDLP